MIIVGLLASSICEPTADFGPARQDLALWALRCLARASHRQARARATQSSTHRARKAHTLTELGKHTQKSANIRTTHKGGARCARANNSTDGGGAFFGAAPIGIVVFPFVCGVNVGGTCVCVC